MPEDNDQLGQDPDSPGDSEEQDSNGPRLDVKEPELGVDLADPAAKVILLHLPFLSLETIAMNGVQSVAIL